MFNLFTKRSVGIDIADHSIEAIELIKDRKGVRVWSKSRVLLEDGIVERGIIKDKMKLAAAVEKAFKEAKPNPIIAKRAVFGLPESTVYIHNFYITSHKKEEREDIILEEARTNIPLESDDLLFDYRVLHESSEKTEILLAGASRKVVFDWHEFFQSLGIETDGFDIESLATFRGLFSKPLKKSVCVVDIGAVTTHIAIFDKTGLWYAYTIDIAGDILTEEIAKALEKSAEEAERIKREVGLSQPGERTSFVLIKVLHPVAENIKATLDYFNEKTGEGVEEIILVGGTSKLKGLTDYFSANIGLPTRLGKPALFSVKGVPLVYIEAIGLALREIDKRWKKSDPAIYIGMETKKHENRRTPKENIKTERQKGHPPRRTKTRKQLIILAVILVLGAIAISSVYWRRANKRSQQEEEIKARLEAIKVLEEIEVEEVVEEVAPEPMITIIKTPTGWLNVREGPGTSYSKTAKVYPDESYTLLEEKNNWYKIKIPASNASQSDAGEDEEIEGWVISDYAEKK